MTHLRIATRRSDLAQWQAKWVAARLLELGCTTELVLITSEGDIDQRPITDASGRGLFTRNIQAAVQQGTADIAVHSLKDLPTAPTDGLVLAAVPERESVRDCLISRGDVSIDQLREGAVIGTGSRRRGAQMRCYRSDLVCEAIRGNVETRLRKLDEGQYDAVILAEAGLKRLGLVNDRRIPISLEIMLPAPGQGALGLEIRRDDALAQRFVSQLNHLPSFACVTAERTLLSDLQGGCLAPIAALGTVRDGTLTLRAAVLSEDGRRRLTSTGSGTVSDAVDVGQRVAGQLLEQGAANLISDVRATA